MKGACKVGSRKEVPLDTIVLPWMFLLTLKSFKDEKTKYTALCVIGGSTDKFKHMTVDSTITPQPFSILVLLAKRTVYELDFYVSDFCQAYLQFTEARAREMMYKKFLPSNLNLIPRKAFSCWKVYMIFVNQGISDIKHFIVIMIKTWTWNHSDRTLLYTLLWTIELKKAYQEGTRRWPSQSRDQQSQHCLR